MSDKIITSISEIIPLKSVYRYDDHVTITSEYKEFENDLKLYVQPLYTNLSDSKFSNKSYFALTPMTTLTGFMTDSEDLNPLDLVIYTTIQIETDTPKSLEVSSDYIYGVSDSSDLFKIIKRVDGYYNISKDGKYLTVDYTKDGYTAKFLEQSSDTDTDSQVFDIQKVEDGYYTIISKFADITTGDPINRGLSMYNGSQEAFTTDGASLSGMIMANGCYSDGSVNLYGYSFNNPYKFKFNENTDNLVIGFDGKIKWVKYHSNIYDKLFNKDVTIKDFIDTITPNILVEYPYNSQIEINGSVGTVGVNMITLKNVMTPSYSYTIKGGN